MNQLLQILAWYWFLSAAFTFSWVVRIVGRMGPTDNLIASLGVSIVAGPFIWWWGLLRK